MLAKVWKKALMAICIIACIYNVMNKLVSRDSLEYQLKSVVNQTGITEIFEKVEENKNEITSRKTETVRNTVSEEKESTIVVIN